MRTMISAGLIFSAAQVAVFAEQPAHRGDVNVLLNLPYRTRADRSCTLDLALPAGAQGKPRPAIVVIHGGGWIEGDKSSFVTPSNRVPGNIRDFAELGFVAAAINYRLSKEAPYPAALDDCRCAIRWLRAHAAQYEVDPARIGAYGNSAGGHLALLLALTDGPAEPGEPYSRESSGVQAAVSDSGPIDLIHQAREGAIQTVVRRFMGGPPDEPRVAEYRRASPSEYVAAKGPPMLLIYGEADEQVDVKVADRFVAALSQAGRKDVTYIRLAGVGHCPHSLVRIPYLRQVVNDFFIRTLMK
jgi:acetyl esterase/lipase